MQKNYDGLLDTIATHVPSTNVGSSLCAFMKNLAIRYLAAG
jgi:hypothetical protein